ncbi:hypothetical protein CDCA_CDCA02G0617 [Cyanidium caldarium]|uniref:START domain-containing protein n=1 Tax=Cyanidium caldarium TaxID=2771 RepID=A0AAV9IQS3_CYACA|nr:hypothetical protein CDCA_CDCA02G0617 [Cyanidium caldarium]
MELLERSPSYADGTEDTFHSATDEPVLQEAYDLFLQERIFAALRTLDTLSSERRAQLAHDERYEAIQRVGRELPPFLADLDDCRDRAYVEAVRTRNMVVKFKRDLRTQLYQYHVTLDAHTPLENLCCILAEPDLFPELLWFLRDAQVLEIPTRVRRAVYVRYHAPWPFADRVLFMTGRAFDALDETSPSILLVIRSVQPSDTVAWQQAQKIRARPEQKQYVEIEARAAFELRPLSPHKTRIRMTGVFDPKLKWVPKALINWVSRKVVRYGMKRLAKSAAQLQQLPTRHWQRLHDDSWCDGLYPWMRRRLAEFWQRSLEQPCLSRSRLSASLSISSDESTDDEYAQRRLA